MKKKYKKDNDNKFSIIKLNYTLSMKDDLNLFFKFLCYFF